MVRLSRPLLSRVGAAALALLLGGTLAVGVAAPARAALLERSFPGTDPLAGRPGVQPGRDVRAQ